MVQITDKILEKGEWFDAASEKNTVYLHHTAGSHQPEWVITGWDNDDAVPDPSTGKTVARVVGTHFVVGGISTSNGDASFDGKIYRALPDYGWIHHLGTKFANNTLLNRQSFGIEICNYGPITLGKDGIFYNYVSKPVPASMVVKLDKPFKGYTYYHAYSDKQIESVKELILFLKQGNPKIELKTPLLTPEAFDLNADAEAGKPGVYTHINVRTDKFDLSPQPKVIEMLKSICQ